jgi:restriction endonuclease S subunit
VHYGDIYKNYSGKTINSSAIINRFAQNVSIKKVLRCDSVIVPDVTETISDWGHFVYVKYDGTPYINGTHTFAITCKSAITLRYLFRYLQASDNVKRLQTLLNGSTVFQISIANFNAFELQNYHDDEQVQRHIVDLRRNAA